MTHLLFNIVYKLSKTLQTRYPVVNDELCEDALYHIGFYLKYGWIISPIWIIQILYREFIEDGHLKRIIYHTESPELLLDLKADLITRFTGLLIPLIIEIGVLTIILI